MIVVETAPYFVEYSFLACSGTVEDLKARALKESSMPTENLYAAGRVYNDDFFVDNHPISIFIDFVWFMVELPVKTLLSIDL